MATVSEHLSQAHKNEAFLSLVRKTSEYADWGTTVVFYIAVHYGRALLAMKGQQITTNTHFQSEYLRIIGDEFCYKHFRYLQTAAEKARYDVVQCDWLSVGELERTHLNPFKDCVVKHGLTI